MKSNINYICLVTTRDATIIGDPKTLGGLASKKEHSKDSTLVVYFGARKVAAKVKFFLTSQLGLMRIIGLI